VQALKISEGAILDRVIRPDSGGWPRAAAKAILGVAFGSRDHQRMSRLLEKAKAGNLSAPEAKEAESYRNVGRMLKLMKSRARRSLKSSS
jgi:hypothetical protein